MRACCVGPCCFEWSVSAREGDRLRHFCRARAPFECARAGSRSLQSRAHAPCVADFLRSRVYHSYDFHGDVRVEATWLVPRHVWCACVHGHAFGACARFGTVRYELCDWMHTDETRCEAGFRVTCRGPTRPHHISGVRILDHNPCRCVLWVGCCGTCTCLAWLVLLWGVAPAPHTACGDALVGLAVFPFFVRPVPMEHAAVAFLMCDLNQNGSYVCAPATLRGRSAPFLTPVANLVRCEIRSPSHLSFWRHMSRVWGASGYVDRHELIEAITVLSKSTSSTAPMEVDPEHCLQYRLSCHLFGPRGDQPLSFERFVEFTHQLKADVLQAEFYHYSNGSDNMTCVSAVTWCVCLCVVWLSASADVGGWWVAAGTDTGSLPNTSSQTHPPPV